MYVERGWTAVRSRRKKQKRKRQRFARNSSPKRLLNRIERVCVVLCWGPRARSVRQKCDPWKSVWHTYDVIFLPTPDLRNFWTCGLSGAAWITNVSGVRVETKKAVLQTSRCNYDSRCAGGSGAGRCFPRIGRKKRRNIADHTYPHHRNKRTSSLMNALRSLRLISRSTSSCF